MSLDSIKKQIVNFLSTDKPEVLAIKGEWGVGKTYTWNKILHDAKQKDIIKLDRYSYVSLFGINSLESFKYSIFENVINKKIIGEETNIETLSDNTKSLLEKAGRQSFSLFKGAPIIKSISPAIDSLAFLSMHKTLICIDDLERKGKNLDIKDILGLASILKEQKKCKIIILLNEGETGLEDYKKYKEKVVDIEILFSPSPLESTIVAFSGKAEYQPKLAKLTTNLGIKNIRVLKKIERLVELAYPLLEEYEAELHHQVVHTIVLYAWCYYCSESNSDIPTLPFITKLKYELLGVGDEKLNDEEKKWMNLLQSYDYQMTDELDLVIAEAVQSGFFVESSFKEKAAAKNKEIIASKSENSFTNAWRLYHDSFNDNTKEVVDGLYNSFLSNCKYISPLNLNGTVRLLRELDEPVKATAIIDQYILERKDETALFNLKEYSFNSDITDKEIIEKFNERYKTSVVNESATDILKRISGKNGWNTKDEIILANTTPEEYYTIFKNETGSHLSSFVSTCLKFGKLVNASELQKNIGVNATKALIRIASESELNRLRVKKFGIDLPEA